MRRRSKHSRNGGPKAHENASPSHFFSIPDSVDRMFIVVLGVLLEPPTPPGADLLVTAEPLQRLLGDRPVVERIDFQEAVAIDHDGVLVGSRPSGIDDR
jgi:hypothetical protein